MNKPDFDWLDIATDRHASLDGVQLAHGLRGESGSPVLLIMGFGVPGRAWVHQVPALSRQHRVAWYDHRGCGGSEAAPGPYDMALLAADASGLLDHLGWDTAHVVGVSMGGMVAQELTLADPKRVRSLSLIATHPGGPRARLPGLAGIKGFLQANAARTRQGRHDAIKRLLFPAAFLESCDPQWLDQVLEADFGRPVPPLNRLSHLAAVMRHDTRDRLERLGQIPTLVVKPAQDLLVRPSQSDLLARLIPNARLLTFPEAGHGVIRQSYPKLNAALLEHFARAEATE